MSKYFPLQIALLSKDISSSDPQNKISGLTFIKQHKFQYILRHFYCTTKQNLCEFEENYFKCHKGSQSPEKE